MSAAKRLIPLLNRVVVEKAAQSNKTAGGIMLPESAVNKLQEAVVIAVGPGLKTKEGGTIPMTLQEGDTVMLPSYGGTEVKMNDKEYMLFQEEDILAKLQ